MHQIATSMEGMEHNGHIPQETIGLGVLQSRDKSSERMQHVDQAISIMLV
jgi:hypothetical protein